ncbi:MAG: ADP-ribosylglycohydrolase family protein [Bacteroidota bacterium]
MTFYHTLLGIAIGDAFGAGVEFQDRRWIRQEVDFTSLVNARMSIRVPSDQLSAFTHNYHPWDYTDDTEMTIGLIKALMSDQPFSESLLLNCWEEEYHRGETLKGYGRNGHGSMSWYFNGSKSIEEIRTFQRNRPNPGNAPAMRSVPLGFVDASLINEYARMNAIATHPNPAAIISSQCIGRAAEWLIIHAGTNKDVIAYCQRLVDLDEDYTKYLTLVDQLPAYEALEDHHFVQLCGSQPIEMPYFLPGIHGVPSDSKFTTGCVLYVLKHSKDAFDALKKSVRLGGDVDSVASICTGIIAGKTGLHSLPAFMLDQVEGKEYLREIATQSGL